MKNILGILEHRMEVGKFDGRFIPPFAPLPPLSPVTSPNFTQFKLTRGIKSNTGCIVGAPDMWEAEATPSRMLSCLEKSASCVRSSELLGAVFDPLVLWLDQLVPLTHQSHRHLLSVVGSREVQS